MIEFGILGPVEVHSEGKSVPLAGPKQKALLAILLLNANRVVATERLVELLWGNDPPDSPINTLQVHVSQLRRALEPNRAPGSALRLLQSRPPGYLLSIEPDQFDLHRFERLTGRAGAALAAGDVASAEVGLREALSLWHGPALADVVDPFARTERARLDELRLRALEDRIEVDLALGRHADVLGELEVLTHDYPLRERVWGQLMLALYRCRRQAEASGAYQRCRMILAEERGMEPSPALQKLLMDILNHNPALELAQPPRPDRPVATAERKSNLRLHLTSFIGREAEVAEVKRLLAGTPLLTLTGAGGVGKTRLALETARQLVAEYPDGVWLVELAPLADPALVATALASSIGVRPLPEQSALDAVIAFVERRKLLLVVDNCEHLLEGCSQVVDAVLRSSAGTQVLATSRKPLGIGGETTFRVPTLLVPADNRSVPEDLERYDGVRLFLTRARAARPDFVLSRDTAGALVRVCRRLDGIPLALELAAVCVRGLSIESLAARLDQRFRLLVGGNASALPRQQTLRATIDWSYDLLGERERVLFDRLAVFAGGWTAEAAEAVCAGSGIETLEVLDLLLRLVDQSLVTLDVRAAMQIGTGTPTAPSGQRYRLLETVRAYAWDRFWERPEKESIRRRHALYMLALADDADRKATGPGAAAWLARMEQEHDNLRAALDWSADADRELGQRLAGAWGPFWMTRGHFAEGRQRLSEALVGSIENTPDHVQALLWAGALASIQGEHAVAREHAEKALALAVQLGDLQIAARLQNSVGISFLMQGDHAAARPWFESSISLARRLGDELGRARALGNLAECAAAENDYAGARQWTEEALKLSRRAEHQLLVLIWLQDLGYMDLQAGELTRAGAHFRESLQIAFELDNPLWVAQGLTCLGDLAAVARQPERSLRLAAAAQACREAGGVTDAGVLVGRWWSARVSTVGLEHIRAMFTPDAADVALDEGRAMTRTAAVTYALAPNDA